MLNIAVSGFSGRMGRRIALLANRDSDIKITGALEKQGHEDLGKDIGALLGGDDLGIPLTSDVRKAVKDAHVMVDFTAPEATISNLKACCDECINMVIGTTGMTDQNLKQLKSAAENIAIVQSSNMSTGVNLLFELVKALSEKIHKDADIEIIETHHKLKKDAPSGTAMTIAEIIAGVKDKDLKEIAVYGRQGLTGERPEDQIGIHSLRACDVAGEHTVVFGLDGERLELTHKAHSRDIFVLGALRAAKFLSDKKTGMYSMKDVLAHSS